MASPGGKLSSVSETEEECGQKCFDFCYFTGFFLYLAFRRSSSVRPYGLPPSPREKVFGVRCKASNYNLFRCGKNQGDLKQITVHQKLQIALLQLHQALGDIQSQTAAIGIP